MHIKLNGMRPVPSSYCSIFETTSNFENLSTTVFELMKQCIKKKRLFESHEITQSMEFSYFSHLLFYLTMHLT